MLLVKSKSSYKYILTHKMECKLVFTSLDETVFDLQISCFGVLAVYRILTFLLKISVVENILKQFVLHCDEHFQIL